MSARDIFNKLRETRAAHAVAALSEFVAGGGRRVPSEVFDDRMKTCEGCSFFVAGKFPRCDSCGCLLQVKLTFPAESCPEGKWDKHDVITESAACNAC